MEYIVVSDLDGTLLDDNFQLSNFTKLVIKKLSNRGIRFVIATGRHYRDVLKFQKELGINFFSITSNGSKIYNSLGNLIFSCNFLSDICIKLQKIRIFDKEIYTHIYKNNKWYINGVLVKTNQIDINNIPISLDVKNRNIFSSNVSKIYFTSMNKKKIKILEKEIRNNFKDKVNTTYSSPLCLEIMPNKISKGFALKFLSNYLRFHLKKCISFGNSLNDQEMLDISGKAYIMNNSDEDLKKSLPHLKCIKNNFDDGVARFLVNFFNI
ncbi:Cof-type HAD-IIB family hydrolase [Buchnera aphidicola]|uniref:Cof-type HAD-IIB family hydrolase n=1 Tax=Buchnera aphidicola TaxID=9 RepID=UPI0034644411